MTALSNYAENEILDHILGTTAFTMPADVYLALFTANPTDANTGTEVSGSGYAREIVTFGAAALGAASNNAEIEFTASGGSWGTITHWGLYDALTVGNLLLHGAFTISKVIGDGDSLVIAIGDLDVSAD